MRGNMAAAAAVAAAAPVVALLRVSALSGPNS
jgi:hypothetical protein